MLRTTSLLTASLLLAAAAQAQCLSAAAVGPVTMVQWSSSAGYGSTFVVQDEGLSNPPIDITPAFGAGGFPMVGAVGTLNQMWINGNGEVYLTDSSLALTQPVGGALYSVNSLAEARGGVGGSPRIFAFGYDISQSTVGGAAWAITADVTPGSVKVTWKDVARLGYGTTDQFSFSMELLAGGSVIFSYSSTFAVFASWCGISIGNDVGTATSPSRSLKGGPIASDSGTEGLLYQSTTFDLANYAVILSPNGLGGYFSTVLCEAAKNVAYGTGCHTSTGAPDPASSLAELYVGSPAAKTALDGNAMLWTIAGNGYVAQWLPGAAAGLYVAPTGGATIVANGDDVTQTFTPSTPVLVPGGTAPTWTISSNGVLTASATGNNGTTLGSTLAAVGTAPGLGWYCWRDFNPNTGGKVKTEEVGNMLYVTFDGVYEYGTTNPATFQWQINRTTGDVFMVWTSMAVSVNTTNLVVGCSLAGVGPTPASTALSSANPYVMLPPANLVPMTLSAAPAPVISPSTVVTYTAGNLPEFVPTSGIYLSTMFLSVNPNPFGFDLNGILTTVPGCNAWIVTLDLDLGAQLTFVPTATWNFTYNNTYFAPGNAIAAQAIGLFDSAFPLVNGESGGFLFSNGVLSTTQTQ